MICVAAVATDCRFYGILNYLGLYNKNAKILFLVRDPFLWSIASSCLHLSRLYCFLRSTLSLTLLCPVALWVWGASRSCCELGRQGTNPQVSYVPQLVLDLTPWRCCSNELVCAGCPVNRVTYLGAEQCLH